MEFLRKDLTFINQSIEEYQVMLKKDRDEILNKQELHPAVLIDIEMKIDQLKNDLANLNHRARITSTYKNEHQSINDKLSPEHMQSQKTFDQMERMTNKDLVEALLTTQKALFEAHGSLTVEKRERLKNAIEDTKEFQRTDMCAIRLLYLGNVL